MEKKIYVVTSTGTSKKGNDYSKLEKLVTTKEGNEFTDAKDVQFVPSKKPLFTKYQFNYEFVEITK